MAELHTFEFMQAEVSDLKAEIERLKAANKIEQIAWDKLIAERDRLRADKKKLLEILGERQCEEMECSIAECLAKKRCCCALEDIYEQLAPDINPYIKPEKRREAIRDMVAEAQKLKLP